MISHIGPFTASVPTPGQIRAGCRRIRREWSPEERATRRAVGREGWRLLVLPHPQFDRPRRVNVG